MTTATVNKYFAKRDVLLLAILIFVVVIIFVSYDALQKGRIDTQDLSVDVPPVLINKIDTAIFEKLKVMTE
ncbi:hypothetical protein KBB12_01570 [Candidatus Woesebacteria bacterium]|nr:hypothetical protein [Candidatus Woesebacteria bacterium]